jgi:hypothetical protein
MRSKQPTPPLPGTSASAPFQVNAILLGVLLLLFVPLMVLITFVPFPFDGHLPWPVVQWFVATPMGLLALAALAFLIAAPSLIPAHRAVLRRSLARAVDVTEVPPWVWLTRPPMRPGETRADRWLGHGRGARVASLALLVIGALIFLLIIASFIAVSVVTFRYIGSAECGAHGCSPQYPLALLAFAGWFASMWLSSLLQYRWLRRVEATAGVWLRLRGWFVAGDYLYIRQPGVTPEAVTAALARFAPGGRAPLVREFVEYVFAISPILLLISAAFFLQGWLQLQWIPG